MTRGPSPPAITKMEQCILCIKRLPPTYTIPTTSDSLSPLDIPISLMSTSPESMSQAMTSAPSLATPVPPMSDAAKKAMKNQAGGRTPVRGKIQGTHPHTLPTFFSDPLSPPATTDPSENGVVGGKRQRGDTTGSLSSSYGEDEPSNPSGGTPAQPANTSPSLPLHGSDEGKQPGSPGDALQHQQAPPSSAETTPTNPPPLLMSQGSERRKGRLDLLDEMRAREESSQAEIPGETSPLFVPKPNNGWPVIHLPFPTSIIDNIKETTVRTWFMQEDAGLFAFVHLLNAWMPGRSDATSKLIKSAVKSAFGLEKLFVAPAIPAVTPNPTDETAAPYAFALLHLDEEDATAILERGCLANDSIAINFFPFDHRSPTTFVGTVKGLLNMEEPDATKALTEDICGALMSSQEVFDAILGHVIACRRDEDVEMDLEARAETEQALVHGIIGELTLTTLPLKNKGGDDAPAVNMYLPSLSDLGPVNDLRWDKILKAIAKINFSFSLFGNGRYARGYNCIQCHGIDHPAGLCPYPRLESWREICDLSIDTLDQYRNRIFKDYPLPSANTATTFPDAPAQQKYAQEYRKKGNQRGGGRGVRRNARGSKF